MTDYCIKHYQYETDKAIITKDTVAPGSTTKFDFRAQLHKASKHVNLLAETGYHPKLSLHCCG